MSGPLEVRTRDGSYPIYIEPGAIRRLPDVIDATLGARRVALMSDDRVGPLHGEAAAELCRAGGLDVSYLTFPAGEASKTRKSWSILTDRMLEAGLGRDAAVVAVGGGVTTDLAGFVAATYMRGISVVQVPTSYLAMIDASVGGKTGVDVRAGKNLVGAFHQPAAVVVDPLVLETLPRKERAEGLVEAIKHGAIVDATHFEDVAGSLEALLAAEPQVAADVVTASLRIKAAVVTEDEREGGYRRILNFGHTIGHALEAGSAYGLGHGRAVAIGMLAEARLGERLGITAEGTEAALATALTPLVEEAAGGSDVEVAPNVALDYLSADKKNRGGDLHCVLLRRIGEVSPGEGWTHRVEAAAVLEALEGVLAGV